MYLIKLVYFQRLNPIEDEFSRLRLPRRETTVIKFTHSKHLKLFKQRENNIASFKFEARSYAAKVSNDLSL